MDGHRVMPIADAVREGDLFVTVTGDLKVISGAHLAAMKDGAIVANSGHFNAEIDIEGLEKAATKRRKVREFVEEFTYPDGHRVYLLGDGRLINLAAAEGHPASVMDMSFANQALAAEYMFRHHGELERKVYAVPEAMDREIARLKLESTGVRIDTLTAEQVKYLESWDQGT
jgi:adenosylhomocysteinase